MVFARMRANAKQTIFIKLRKGLTVGLLATTHTQADGELRLQSRAGMKLDRSVSLNSLIRLLKMTLFLRWMIATD